MNLIPPSFVRVVVLLILFVLVWVPSTTSAGAEEKAGGGQSLTFVELMKFRTVEKPVISDDGRWIAYAANPDRGDGSAFVRSTTGQKEYEMERGGAPRVSSDGRWAAALIEPSLEQQEKAKGKGKKGKEGKGKKDKPKTGLAWIDLESGDQTRIQDVESFTFSDDGRWLAYKRFHEEEEDEEEKGQEEEKKGEEAKGEEAKGEEEDKEDKKNLGSSLMLRDLRQGEEHTLEHVKDYAFDKPSAFLAYTISAPKGEGNGVYLRRLGEKAAPAESLRQENKARYTHLTWAAGRRDHRMSLLAFIEAPVEDDETGDGSVWIWEAGSDVQLAASSENVPQGWHVPSVNKPHWSRDGQRLFFGLKPDDPKKKTDEDEADENEADEDEAGEGEVFDPYDFETLLKKRELDVWHWNDPLIQTHQKKRWKDEKDRTYQAVFHRGPGDGDPGRVVPLADREVRTVEPTDNPRWALAMADTPYLKEVTWDGTLLDAYVVNLENGERHLVAHRLRDDFTVSLSPGGRYILFYNNNDDGDDSNGHWHLFDTETQETRNLTEGLSVHFASEDNDYPMPGRSYRMAEWLGDESAVLVYDKFDIWRLPTSAADEPQRLTEGRAEYTTFRVVDLDREDDALAPDAPLLLTAYHDREKYRAFYGASLHQTSLHQTDIRKLYETRRHWVNVVAKAKNADRLLFTRENYNEFPDLYVTDLQEKDGFHAFGEPSRLTEINPQIKKFAWGEPELVEWRSLNGTPMQGVLIKPGNYEPGKQYPVLVYYYRFFSQRLHQFNDPAVNHRPSFPLYASNGYAVFLPDIRFEVGRPGFAATKSLVPGVQKLIDMGIADPDAIGLHGHSWSGYQTAFMITQTHLFKAAVAGAPVSNMTSAYSGIRLTSGLARQFQYEKAQSRIGGSLWEYPERYIENSPVFFADRIETPLLIQFGDEDGAVPWQQGIELYMAMRRLGKDCIFLQYRGEGHHLRKPANKLDYSIKMKEYLDHHLKGVPAPEWMTRGVPYAGK